MRVEKFLARFSLFYALSVSVAVMVSVNVLLSLTVWLEIAALTFSLVSSLSGASINPVTGVFTWAGTEAQGPSTYTMRVRVTDNGSPNSSDTKSFTVTVQRSKQSAGADAHCEPSQATSVNTIAVRVTDNGVPPLSDTKVSPSSSRP